MDAADIRSRTRSHLIAFAIVLVLALTAAGVSMAGIAGPAIVIGIAAVQAAVVLIGMMHAPAEGAWVRGTLAFAAFFVTTMLVLFVLGHHSTIVGTEVLHAAPSAAAEEAH